MPYTIAYELITNVDNRTARQVFADTAEVILQGIDKSVPAAKTGDLTTRTSDTVGTITLDPGHGLTTGRMDIYWSTGKRRGVTGTVTVDSLAITGGAGDILPAALSEVTVQKPEQEAFTLASAANIKALIASADASVVFQIVLATSGDVEVFNVPLVSPYNGYSYVQAAGGSDPITGDVARVYISHADATASRSGRVHAYGA